MGTRCLTIVYNHDKPILNLYRQYDGYPGGHGAELAEFLGQFEAITNGIDIKETRKTANGMGCLAAQLVAHFKTSVGGMYIHSVEDTECGQDYEYHVYEKDRELCVQVRNRGFNAFGLTLSETNESIFNGPVSKFDEFCTEETV
jgi:hypothetical protein